MLCNIYMASPFYDNSQVIISKKPMQNACVSESQSNILNASTRLQNGILLSSPNIYLLLALSEGFN